jgi:hypothetical protein
MSERSPELRNFGNEADSYEITPFDDLAKYLEDHERTDVEKLEAVARALKAIVESPDNYPDGLDEVTGIALESNIDPDEVIRIFEELESKEEEK